jgi:hypothetical protein
MAIVHINKMTLLPGKRAELVRIWPELQKVRQQMSTAVSRIGMVSVTGSNPGGAFTMITTFDSLADWEKDRTSREQDLPEIMKQWMALFEPGSREFTVHETLG